MTIQPYAQHNCACFNIRRAARHVTQAYDHALKPVGLQATQFSLLAMIDGVSSEKGIALTELAARLGMDRTTLTRNLAVAERAKWIVTRSGKDRRERLIKLTLSGRRKLNKARPLWKLAQEQVVKKLSVSSLSDLLALTHRLSAD
ncbi:MAG: MarR family transcriptional regulator [Alphaproteobacteria bacterium]|nr:MarR family transcriptional regulator [Alphaproteobacteria bacterium]